jgi:DNA-directed RNA polymerase subunit RPC12/RpoP
LRRDFARDTRAGKYEQRREGNAMSPTLPHEADFKRSTFIQSCAYCGARFEVLVSRLAGSDEEEDYDCPECGKRYTTMAALPPLVNLTARRSDGKSDGYQETMF